jgi:hypothetical protein
MCAARLADRAGGGEHPIMARRTAAPAWRRAFLRELARSGSVALAAQAVGIDRSSAYQARKGNAAFATSWERALERARETLSPEADAGERPPRLRDDEVVRASRAGKPCILLAGEGRWCARSERDFLATLGATANVKAAARAAGVSTVAVYKRRRKWPAFRAAWDEAKEEGYVRIEMLLIDAATNTLDPAAAAQSREADEAPPEMTVEQAMKLWFHRAGRDGARGGRGFGWRLRPTDIEEVRAELLRKVAALEKARARGLD